MVTIETMLEKQLVICNGKLDTALKESFRDIEKFAGRRGGLEWALHILKHKIDCDACQSCRYRSDNYCSNCGKCLVEGGG